MVSDMNFIEVLEGDERSYKVIKGHGRSWKVKKVKEGHGCSFPITGLTFQVRKVRVGVLGGWWPQSHFLSSGLWIWDLDFGTWIWDLDLGLGLGLTISWPSCGHRLVSL